MTSGYNELNPSPDAIEYFYSGDRAKCNLGKYKGESIIVEHWAPMAGPNSYTCKTLGGKSIVLNADKWEIVSLFRFNNINQSNN